MTQSTSANQHQKSRLNIQPPTASIQNRVIWRLRLLFIIIFVIVAIFIFLNRQNTAIDVFVRFTQGSLSAVERSINDHLSDPIVTVSRLANSTTNRLYAQGLVRLTTTAQFNATMNRLQTDMLRSFDDIVSLRRNFYNGIRYILRDGRVWGEVINLPNETRISAEVSRTIPATDPLLTALLSRARVGEPFLNLERVIVNDEPVNILKINVPVTALGNTANIFGFTQLEIRLDVLNSAINDILTNPLARQEGREIVLVDSQNQIIAISPNFSLDPDQLNAYLDGNPGELLLSEWRDTGYVVSTTVIDDYVGNNMRWRVVILDNWSLVMNPTIVGSALIISLIALMFLSLVLLIGLLLSPILKPLNIINNSLQRLVRDNQQITLNSRFTTEIDVQPDEVGQILTTIDYLGRSLKQMNVVVDEQFRRRNRELEVATRIGREVANLYDIDQLLNRAISLICTEFGFYHAQVFLVDDARMNAVLRYSYGKAGEKLLAQNFKIPVGSESVIGMVTGKGQPVIVNDTRWHDKSAPYAQNPILTDTRAELGLPLRSGGQVIGVLDIQSRTTNAFKEEDLPVYSLLADQLAVAITTARLLSQTEKRIQQIDSLNKQLTRIAWESAEQRMQLDSSYVYNLVDVQPKAPPPSTNEAFQTPIIIRGEHIGQIMAMPDVGQEMSEGDKVILQAVASRVALAIENARLFQETQNSLAETSTLYQLSQYLNEADTLEEILQSIIISMTNDASGGQIWMFNETEIEENGTPIWSELVADYAITPRAVGDETLTRLRVRIADHQFLRDAKSDRISLINNAQQDARVDPLLATILERLNARALVLIPISVRGLWRGFITITFPQPRQFSDREGRIFSALSDQAGVAIDNRLLLRQTEEEVARNENLYAASRIINTSQSAKDLVYAAVATNTNPALSFALSLLEGELDATGWPTQARMVARSEHGIVHEIDVLYPVFITPDSPMRLRNPEIIIDETPNNPNVPSPVKWIRAQGYRFMAIFPLFSANQPIALFHITSNQLYELQATEYEVYRALTGQMSSQIQIRRLLQTAQSALDETSRLYVASRAITTAQDFEELYTAAVEHLARPFLLQDAQTKSSAAFGIALFLAWPYPTANAPYLEVAYEWHNNPNTPRQFTLGERLSADDYPYGRISEGRDTTVVFDNIIQADDPILKHEPVLRTRLLEAGIWSLAIAPIRSRVKWFGVIACQHERPRAFNEQYARFMMALADQIAIALDNLRLVEEARFEASRAQIEAQRALALAEAAQLANRIAGDDIAVGMDDIFARVAEDANFDRWLLMRVSETDPDMLETLVGKIPGFDEAIIGLQYNLYFELPMIDSLRRGSTLLINDPAHYPSVVMMDDAVKEGIISFFGKHIATPVTLAGQRYGVIMMGRSLDAEDLDVRDQQLVETLATQVSIALENRRLFRQTQQEQQNLKSILETLPAGVLVLDPITLIPMQFNQQAQVYLGQEIDPLTPFTIEKYNLYRTGTQLLYPQEEMPIFLALATGEEAATDDVAVIVDDIQIDLLVNAAPIKDENGGIKQIVVALQDITSLRTLENTLQENLRETVSLYEAQRQLAEAVGLSDVLDVVITHLGLQQPTDAYILMRDIHQKPTIVRAYVQLLDSADPFIPFLQDSDNVLIENIADAKNITDTYKQFLIDAGIFSFLTMPIRISTSDKPYAWLVIVDDKPYGIGLDDERVYTQLRDVSATAIDNRLLLESQAATVREVRLLYNATNNIARSRDMSQLVAVLEEAIQTFDADYAFGYLAPESGLILEGGVLFQITKPDMPPIDFASVFEDYDIPPGGVYINDIEEVIDRLPTEKTLLEAGVYSFAAIHLRPKDINSGFIMVGYRDIHNFTESEDRYLNTLADGASVLLNTFILFDQIQSSLEETSTLYQASRNLANAANVNEILDVLVNYLIAPHINQVFITLLNASGGWQTVGASVDVVASWSEGDAINLYGMKLNRDLFPAWELLASPTLATIDDIDALDDVDPLIRAGVEAMGLRSVIVIPLRVPKRAIGAVWLGSTEPHVHNDREIRTYQAFAEQASLSMEASYLLEQTERRARQLETSAQVSRNAAQILNLEELLPKVVELIKDSFGYDHVQIFLMDDQDTYAELVASTGEAGQQLLAIHHKLQKGSKSVIGQVTALGEPQIASDTADAAVVHRPNPYLPLTRSEMALPLIIKGRVVGALDVQSNQPNAFNEEDVKALTTLAAQISVAIDNATLYKTAQQQAENMGFLFNITSTAVSADTLEHSLYNVAEQLYQSLHASAIIVYTPVTYEDTLNKQNNYQTLKAVALVGSESPLDELEEVRLDNPDNLISLVASNKQPFIVSSLADENRYIPVHADTQSLAMVPLVFSNQLVGMIILEDDRPNAFGYEVLQLLLAMSGSLSAVVQSAQLREELQKSNQQLMELDRLKSDFLANMSHELRTPLNSIIGFSRVMLKGIDGPLTEMQEQDLTTIYNSGQHLLYLINEILDQAKIAAEKLDLKFGYFEIKPVVEGVKSIGIGLVKDKNLDLNVELANNLPKAYGDEFRTRQILLNLVSNAAKFTHQGGITIRVYPVTNAHGKTMIKIDVIDTGIGISEKDLPLIFQPFRQVDSSLTRTQGGTGLGLPIAKSLTELQGGEMTASSVEHRGSTFSITVPTEPTVDVPQDDKPQMPAVPKTGPLSDNKEPETKSLPVAKVEKIDTKPNRETTTTEVTAIRATTPMPKVMQVKRQIVLIEDNKDMVDQFRRALQREGFEVVVADHPAYAEAMVSNLRPTLIIMDVNFADGQGWQVLKSLKDRDDTFDIPVIVVTLNSDSQRAYQLGAHTFIQRPYMPDDLIKAVLKAEQESNTERILIIDDDPASIRLLTQLLNQNGAYRVFYAENGTDGISMVARRRPDLIILDLRMPGKDGFAVLEELRSNPETVNIPVIVVTGELNLNSDEQTLLSNIHILYKSDISQAEYDRFIQEVRRHLDTGGND
jgi:GAF domain-containing protein/DNA-binding response OmpR family regulator